MPYTIHWETGKCVIINKTLVGLFKPNEWGRKLYPQISVRKITIIEVYAKWHGTKIYIEKSHFLLL